MKLVQLFVMIQVAYAVQVSTKNGKLKGEYIRNQLGNSYYVFRTIPYAKPIRNEDIQPIGKWNGVKDATIGWRTKFNSTNDTQWFNDCLYLTIYTKKIKRWLPPTMVRTFYTSPVEVYFLGCNLYSEENQTESLDNILQKDVVKVVVHHRKSAYSSSGDTAAKDQLVAMEWIKENINVFGGDPQRVAVFQGHAGLGDIDINRLSHRSSTAGL